MPGTRTQSALPQHHQPAWKVLLYRFPHRFLPPFANPSHRFATILLCFPQSLCFITAPHAAAAAAPAPHVFFVFGCCLSGSGIWQPAGDIQLHYLSHLWNKSVQKLPPSGRILDIAWFDFPVISSGNLANCIHLAALLAYNFPIYNLPEEQKSLLLQILTEIGRTGGRSVNHSRSEEIYDSADAGVTCLSQH